MPVLSDEARLTVSDDDGLLGLVDHFAYRAFVSEDWTLEQLFSHFNDEMARSRILVWDCGDGGDNYRIHVRHRITSQRGFREVVGGLIVTKGALLVSSYTALTMAAQFEDERLPGTGEAEQLIEVAPGGYRVRVVQMYDPASLAAPAEDSPHFLLELEPGNCEPWSRVAWLSAGSE